MVHISAFGAFCCHGAVLGLDAVSGTFLLAAPVRTDRQDFDWQEALGCSAERTRRWLLATACAYWAIDLVHG